MKLMQCISMTLLLLITGLHLSTVLARAMPRDFVELSDVAPTIKYDIRYAGYHNFIGRPVKGYYAPRCILTKSAAKALARVQQELLKSRLSLMVYDCYRPQEAVNDFIAWSKLAKDNRMKKEFYPKVTKNQLFPLGYVAERSGHSRGSTVDLTIVPLSKYKNTPYQPNKPLIACTAPYLDRFYDGSIDMGTGYDCMDPRSHPANTNISIVAYQHRMMLRKLMQKYGFKAYSKEWWHFTLKHEPYPRTYFIDSIMASSL